MAEQSTPLALSAAMEIGMMLSEVGGCSQPTLQMQGPHCVETSFFWADIRGASQWDRLEHRIQRKVPDQWTPLTAAAAQKAAKEAWDISIGRKLRRRRRAIKKA